jgi:hypothetical protein
MTGNTQQVLMWIFDRDKDAVWDIEPHKERKGRSLNANSYFHVLVQKLAQAQQPPVSLAKCKNMMIAAYGQPEYIDGQQAIIKSNVPQEKMQEIEYLHTALVKISEENGTECYFYRIYRGTHTYNNIEMQKLIEGVVQECKDAGIETATPAEIAKMIDVWGLKNGKKI